MCPSNVGCIPGFDAPVVDSDGSVGSHGGQHNLERATDVTPRRVYGAGISKVAPTWDRGRYQTTHAHSSQGFETMVLWSYDGPSRPTPSPTTVKLVVRRGSCHRGDTMYVEGITPDHTCVQEERTDRECEIRKDWGGVGKRLRSSDTATCSTKTCILWVEEYFVAGVSACLLVPETLMHDDIQFVEFGGMSEQYEVEF
jgi:hypothetical protein